MLQAAGYPAEIADFYSAISAGYWGVFLVAKTVQLVMHKNWSRSIFTSAIATIATSIFRMYFVWSFHWKKLSIHMCRHCHSHFFSFSGLKNDKYTSGESTYVRVNQPRAKRPVTTSRMTNTVLIGQILLSPDELPLGETTFGLNELIPIKLFIVLQSPHHRIP